MVVFIISIHLCIKMITRSSICCCVFMEKCFFFFYRFLAVKMLKSSRMLPGQLILIPCGPADLCAADPHRCRSGHRSQLLVRGDWSQRLVPGRRHRADRRLPRLPQLLGIHHRSQHHGAHLAIRQVSRSTPLDWLPGCWRVAVFVRFWRIGTLEL